MRWNKVYVRWLTVIGVVILVIPTLTASAITRQPLRPYFYLTSTTLVLMNGNREVVQVPYASNQNNRRPSWTLDGQYVVMLEGDPKQPELSSTRQMVSVRVADGHVQTFPCPDCTSLAAVGESKVLASQADAVSYKDSLSSVLRYDLRTGAPPAEFKIESSLVKHVFFASGVNGQALVSGWDSNGNETYESLTINGTLNSLGARNLRQGPFGTNAVHGITATSAIKAPDGSIVYAVAGEFIAPGQCRGLPEVLALSSADKSFVATDIMPVVNDAMTRGQQAAVARDLNWEADGTLHAVFDFYKCATDDVPASTSEWQLLDGNWVPYPTDRPGKLLTLSNWAKVEFDAGRLWLEVDGSRRQISDQAIFVSVLPESRIGPANTSDTHPCLLDVKQNIGTQVGDVNGDGRPDRVQIDRCKTATNSGSRLDVTLSLAGGDDIVTIVRDQYLSDEAKFLGIADVNGDGRGDIALSSGGLNTQNIARIYEYRGGTWTPIRGDLGRDDLLIDSSTDRQAGFACRTSSGQAVLTTTQVKLDASRKSYVGKMTTFRPDADHVLRKTDEKNTSYPAIEDPDGRGGVAFVPPNELDVQTGANCEGLNRWPQ